MATTPVLKAKMTINTSELTRGFAKAKAEAKSFGYQTGYLAGKAPGMALKALAVAAAAGGAAMVVGTKRAFDYGAGLKRMSDRTGIAVDSLAVMQEQFKDANLDADALTSGVGKLQKNLVEATRTGAGPAAQALSLIGESAEDLIRLDPAEYFTRIGKGIAGIKNPAIQASTAIALFGKQGTSLLPMFKGEGFESMAAIVGSQAKILKANADLFLDVNNRLSHAGIKLQGFFVGFAAQIAPGLDNWLQKIDKMDLAGKGEAFGKFVSDAADKLKAAIDAIPEGTGATAGNLVKFGVKMVQTDAKALASALQQGIAAAQEIVGAGKSGGEAIAAMATKGFNSKQAMSALAAAGMHLRNVPAAMATARKLSAEPPETAAAAPASIGGSPANFWARHPFFAGNPKSGYDLRKNGPFESGTADPFSQNPLGRGYKAQQSGLETLKTFTTGTGNLPAGTLDALGYSGGLKTGGSGGLGGGAYDQSPLLKHSEIMKGMDAQYTAALLTGDPDKIAEARDMRSTSGGYDVVRRGDKDREKNLKKEEARKSMNLEGTNERLGTLINMFDKAWLGGGGKKE